MRSRMTAAIVIVLFFAASSAANDQLIAALKQTGKAVDNMTAAISQVKSDAEAETVAGAVRQALDNGLKQDHPTIVVKASAGFCRVTIETPGWKLWSEAHDGKISDHGATVH